jgi:hypothetical protein
MCLLTVRSIDIHLNEICFWYLPFFFVRCQCLTRLHLYLAEFQKVFSDSDTDLIRREHSFPEIGFIP